MPESLPQSTDGSAEKGRKQPRRCYAVLNAAPNSSTSASGGET